MALVEAGGEEPIDDRYGKAVYYMEKLFPLFEGKFNIHDVINASKLSKDEKNLARRLERDIDEIMLFEKGYSQTYPYENCWRKLTYSGKSFQEHINQKLLFDKLKQSPNYSIPLVKGIGVLLNGRIALKEKGIVIEKEFPTYTEIRLNSDVTMATSYKEALDILERKHMIPPTTINFHQTTHGDNSPISGRDTFINEPDEKQKIIAKKSLRVSRSTLLWTIGLSLLAILVSILIAHQLI
jgi:hypothetical protein